MAPISPDFKWLGFRISDPLQNPDPLQANLFLTIQNPDNSRFIPDPHCIGQLGRFGPVKYQICPEFRYSLTNFLIKIMNYLNWMPVHISPVLISVFLRLCTLTTTRLDSDPTRSSTRSSFCRWAHTRIMDTTFVKKKLNCLTKMKWNKSFYRHQEN